MLQHAFESLVSNLGYMLSEILAWFSAIRCDVFKQLFAVMNSNEASVGIPLQFMQQLDGLFVVKLSPIHC